MRKSVSVFALLAAAGLVGMAASGQPAAGLLWQPASATNTASPGDITSLFIFTVRNLSDHPITINQVKPACDCTTAQMPRVPWIMPPNTEDKLEVLMDLRGKISGPYTKDVIVFSTAETNLLEITVNVPLGFTNGMNTALADRLFGQQLTHLDRQAVFKTSCVKCHLVPSFGKSGERLYVAACGICHDATNRAPMVPDLHALKAGIDTNYWTNWVLHGKPGTLMPGFAAREGGPLLDADVISLVNYLTNAFPRPIKPPLPTADAKK